MITVTCLDVFLKEKIVKKDFPRIFLLGKSNVGKSSFINFFLNQKVAKSSKNPGKTLFLNHYLVNKQFYLIDTPGYGYMKNSLIRKNLVSEIMQNFFFELKKENIFVILLINIFKNISQLDLFVIENILKNTKKLFILVSKADKLNQSNKYKVIKTLKNFFLSINLDLKENFAFFSLKDKILPINLENQILTFISEFNKI